MRIIFSRKGFDSQYGRVPSPIFPDGSFVSVPIPSAHGRPLGDVRIGSGMLAEVVHDLTRGTIHASTSVHLDPDLVRGAISRKPDWRPTFGQVGAAQSHLAGQGVGRGDVFLFFGWFRRVELHAGAWRFIPGSPGFHSLFGWLQVDQVIAVDGMGGELVCTHEWLEEHPHVRHAAALVGKSNTLYVGAERVNLSGMTLSNFGGGAFERWAPSLRLSEIGASRSVWMLPAWMEPIAGRVPLTYHSNVERWQRVGESVLLRTAAKGQEFVLNTDSYPEAVPWLRSLLERHA